MIVIFVTRLEINMLQYKYKGENYWCLCVVCMKYLICNCCWVCLCCLSKFGLAVATAALTHIAVRSYIFIRWEVPPSDFYTPIDYAVINPSDSVGVLREKKLIFGHPTSHLINM